MKFFNLIVAGIVAVTAAKPPGHLHRRAHAMARRDAKPDQVVDVPVAIETVYKYILDGHEISQEEVRQGLANGTLVWGSDGVLSSSLSLPVALPTPSSISSQQPATKVRPTESKSEAALQSSSQPAVQPSTVAAPQTSPSSTVAAPQASSPSGVDTTPKNPNDLVDKNGNCASCDIEFPNGKIPCSEFPYGYGAIPLNQEGLGGWSGIQDPHYRGNDGFDDIRTVVSGSCKDSTCCTAGTYCSYGCPNPYLKLSFPKIQGRTGQTVGGLFCNNDGMLEMADGSIGKTLCGKDSQNMNVKVHNRLSKPVSFCRTDYPGTESMTFPLTLNPGETGFLASPDQQKYFFWQGKPTSAHYYINRQGVSEAEGCTWSKPGGTKGNWAPAIFGTSFDDMKAHEGFSSLKQNELNKNNPLDYSITFTGDGVVSPCSYKRKTDQYCQGDTCWTDRDRGCTAAIKQGSTLTLVLHDD